VTTAITAEMEPQKSEATQRISFLARACTEVCSRALSIEMARARAGQFGEGVKSAAAQPLTKSDQFAAIKNLSAAFIYLMMVDYVPLSPEWLKDFLSTTARSLDRVVEGPTVREILMSHSGVTGYGITQEAASEVSRALHFQKVSGEFSAPLQEFLENSKPLRTELLMFALLEPVDELNRQLESSTS
jgi:hypothetical protein